MYIARIIYPINVLGPGTRIGIWFAGCTHGCKGCSNPELWARDVKYMVDCRQVMSLVHSIADYNQVEGITITGGDPLEQPEALRELLPELNSITADILLYTGYTFDQILGKYEDILQNVAVVIDGPYVESLNHGESLRGSTNQNIIILKKQYTDLYARYMRDSAGQIQNFFQTNGFISVGIHRPNFEKELEIIMKKKGFIKDEGN